MRTLLITTTNSSKTVFGWFVDQETRLHRQLLLMRVRRGLRAAFARFAQEHPQLVDSLFDAHFVETRVAPLVARAVELDTPVRPEAITAVWFAACQAPAATAERYDLSAITAAAAELLDYLEAELRPYAAGAEAVELASAYFAEAVQADSNRELDWLWLASQVGDEEQRRFCYEKALFINPASDTARRALAELSTRLAPARELALGEA